MDVDNNGVLVLWMLWLITTYTNAFHDFSTHPPNGGSWYSHSSFGDPESLRNTKIGLAELTGEAVRDAQRKGAEDLTIAQIAFRPNYIAESRARGHRFSVLSQTSSADAAHARRS